MNLRSLYFNMKTLNSLILCMVVLFVSGCNTPQSVLDASRLALSNQEKLQEAEIGLNGQFSNQLEQTEVALNGLALRLREESFKRKIEELNALEFQWKMKFENIVTETLVPKYQKSVNDILIDEVDSKLRNLSQAELRLKNVAQQAPNDLKVANELVQTRAEEVNVEIERLKTKLKSDHRLWSTIAISRREFYKEVDSTFYKAEKALIADYEKKPHVPLKLTAAKAKLAQIKDNQKSDYEAQAKILKAIDKYLDRRPNHKLIVDGLLDTVQTAFNTSLGQEDSDLTKGVIDALSKLGFVVDEEELRKKLDKEVKKVEDATKEATEDAAENTVADPPSNT